METDAWRDRLRAVVEDRGLSKRGISLRAGLGQGYLHSILTEGKDPTIQNLTDVCAAIPVSMAYILYGFDVTPEDEAIIAAMHESPAKRDAVLTLIGNPRLEESRSDEVSPPSSASTTPG